MAKKAKANDSKPVDPVEEPLEVFEEEDELQPEFEPERPAGPLVEKAGGPPPMPVKGVVRHGRAGQDLTDSEMDGITNETASILARQPKVQAFVPIDTRLPDSKPELQVETVCINGYVMQITRGQWVMVPETVGEILAGAGYMVAPAR